MSSASVEVSWASITATGLRPANSFDTVCGQLGEVCQGATFDFAAFAIAIAQQDSRRRVSVRDFGDVDKQTVDYVTRESLNYPSHGELPQISAENFGLVLLEARLLGCPSRGLPSGPGFLRIGADWYQFCREIWRNRFPEYCRRLRQFISVRTFRWHREQILGPR
jgi:hypothetical protein